MSRNKKQTSKDVASIAAETLNDQNASQIAKSLAGSVLSQFGNNNQTGSEMEDKAAAVIRSSKYNERTKTLAGSVLSQSNKER
jgi:hypothetical protein